MKIIISAYECSPCRGSEAGLGWNWIVSAYKNPQIELAYVFTIDRYEQEIKEYISNNKEFQKKIHFVFVPLPLKSVRINQRFKYLIWQKVIGKKAAEIAKSDNIDFCHHVTWATCVLPTHLHESGVPFIYGPIGGGERIPACIDLHLNRRDSFVEKVRNVLADSSIYFPSNRKSYERATIILSTTEETKKLIPLKHHGKVKIMQSIGISRENIAEEATIHDHNQFIVLMAARMIYWKGIEIAVSAFRKLKDNNVLLKVVGDGRELEKYKSMTINDSNIEFLGNIPFKRMQEEYQRADCVLNCSLHDSGCMVVLEAMSQGCPVIAIDTGGPSTLLTKECGIKIEPTSIDKMSNEIAEGIMQLKNNVELRRNMGNNGIKRVRHEFMFDNKYNEIFEMIALLKKVDDENG